MDPICAAESNTSLVSQRETTKNRLLTVIKGMLDFVWANLPAAALALFILVAWEVLSSRGVVKSYVAPAPSKVLSALCSSPQSFWKNTWVTIKEVVFGYAVGLGVGMPLGIAITYSRRMERALYPLIVASQTVPVIALAPILVIWFGFSIWPKLIIVALITFFPVTLGTVDGLRSVDPEMLRFLRSLGATERQMFFKIRMPSAMPQIFTGIKVSITYAVIAAVIGEWVGAEVGLGAMMLRAQHEYYMDVVFATVLVMVVLGFLALQLAISVEHLAIPWHVAKRKRT
jgi:ABC-type nitrate/sulfonate/bicarbonate transport system permease component